ncbi:MAG: hypothetical protein AB7G28_10615 [Pirellulales bacterium]
MAPPLVLGLIGAWLATGWVATDLLWLRWLGGTLVAVASCVIAALAVQMSRPRVAFENGQVLFYLASGAPIAVPLELVEAFFLGQGPLVLPGARQGDESVNLVARISGRDPSFAEREVKRALGAWCDHYVTMRGTWCEPLTGELIRSLNHRLREVTERARAEAAGEKAR